MHSRRLILRHGLVSLSFVLLFLALNRPEVVFFSRIGFVAWYPAIGLVMALMLGVSPWYALLVCFSDVLAGKVIYAQPIRSFSTLDAVGLAVCYGVAAHVLRGPLQIDLGLRRRRDVVRYVLVSTAAATAATIIGVACLIADHSIASADYKSSTVGWFMGDAIGLVGIAPFLLVHVFPHVRKWIAPPASPLLGNIPSRSTKRTFTVGALAEACAQALVLLATVWVMFGTAHGHYDYFYLCFIPIIWIAIRQGIRRVVTGLLALNFGIVVAMHFFPPTPALFIKVALLMLVLSAVGLIVGSEVSERHRLALDLNEQTTYLDSLIQNSPLAIVVLNRQGSVELANSAFEKLFQYDRHEFAAMDFGSIRIPDDDATDSTRLIPQVFAGTTQHKTVRQRRKDGGIVDLAFHGVPLLLTGEIRGAYLIYEDISQQIRASEAQRQHAESLDRLVKELELRTKQMTELNEMGHLLECSATVSEACQVAAHSVQKLFPNAACGALYLFRSSRDLVEAAVRWGKRDALSPTFPPDSCWSLRRGQPHWSGHPGNSVDCLHIAGSPTSENLCVPMVAQGNTLGVLQIEFDAEADPWHDSASDDLRDARKRLAISISSQIALSLANLQLRDVLREQAIRDPLTRLFNRRFLEESLERELRRAARKKQSVAVLFLDIDHFKTFNDTFGHEAGDRVLVALADLFRNFFRATDICCRYGGEEFAIILPESSSRDTAVRADALRLEVKRLRLQFKKETLGQLSISAGVAAFPEHGLSSHDLLRIADQCLYESKSSGRDIVTVAVPEKV